VVPKEKCCRCLETGHAPTNCHFKSAKCNKCHKTVYIAQTRESPQGKQTGQKSTQKQKAGMHNVEEGLSPKPEIADILHVHTTSPHIPRSNKVLTTINSIPVTLELDTGAGVTIVSETTWPEKLNKPDLQDCSMALHSYPNRSLNVMGSCSVEVSINRQIKYLPLVVVKGDGISLLECNWLEALKLNGTEVACINNISRPSKLGELLDECDEIFRDKLGHCKYKAKFHVKHDASPKFYRPRPVPLAMKEKIEEELNRLSNSGIISQVQTSEWATPTVPVKKPNGSVRMCGDYKVTINPYLNVNQYPLPWPEELFSALNNGRHFIKLDLSEAYLQVELDEESQKYLVINTHKGLFCFNRVPHGVASAPAIFQQIMEQILPKLPKVVCYIDDILITACTEEHLQNLRAVF